MRRIHQSNVVFIHIPKTAGQAVTNAFGEVHRSSDHGLQSDEDKVYMGNDFIRFCVIRHPINRFISAYKYQCHMQFNQPEKVKIRALITKNSLDKDINEFVKYIEQAEIKLSSILWFRPQMEFINFSRPQIILRHENLENDLQIVRRIIPEHYVGLSPVNVSKGRNRSDSANCLINQKSLEFLQKEYENDFLLLGYKNSLT